MILKNKIILSLITILMIFSFAVSVFSTEIATIEEQIIALKDILNSSSTYSTFQTNMLRNSAQGLLEAGISFQDIRGIIENSVAKTIDAYSVKKVFDILLETKNDSLPTGPLINKINEGLAKNINKNTLISVISTKAENLKQANEILTAARQEGLKINDNEKIIEILASSLENDVPQEALSWLVKTGIKEGKSIEEITEINEELGYLSLMASDSGLSTEKISLLFKKAIDSSSNLADICENIKENLESEISIAKIESGGVKPSTTLGSGTSPTSLTGSETTIGGTPTGENGGAPVSSNPPADGTPSPPEN